MDEPVEKELARIREGGEEIGQMCDEFQDILRRKGELEDALASRERRLQEELRKVKRLRQMVSPEQDGDACESDVPGRHHPMTRDRPR